MMRAALIVEIITFSVTAPYSRPLPSQRDSATTLLPTKGPDLTQTPAFGSVTGIGLRFWRISLKVTHVKQQTAASNARFDNSKRKVYEMNILKHGLDLGRVFAGVRNAFFSSIKT